MLFIEPWQRSGLFPRKLFSALLTIVVLISGCSSIMVPPRLPADAGCGGSYLHAVSGSDLMFTFLWRSRSEIKSCEPLQYKPGGEVEKFSYSEGRGEISVRAARSLKDAPAFDALSETTAKTLIEGLNNLIPLRHASPPFQLNLVVIPAGSELALTVHSLDDSPELTFFFPFERPYPGTDDELIASTTELLKILAIAGHELFHALLVSAGRTAERAVDEEKSAHLVELCLLGRIARVHNIPISIRISGNLDDEPVDHFDAVSTSIAGKTHALQDTPAGNGIQFYLTDQEDIEQICGSAAKSIRQL